MSKQLEISEQLIISLRRQLLATHEALAFYADESNYDCPLLTKEGVLCDGYSRIDLDEGKFARKTLGIE